jgi:uncharacterized protein (TIGR04255 family)
MASTPLPKFDSPPVIETALGVEFAPLEKWAVPHFGLYWELIRDRFPKFEVQPPAPSRIEDPATVFRKVDNTVSLHSGPPPVRCWFIDASDAMLVQIQSSRFIFNWRKRGEPYPEYEKAIRPRFIDEWRRFVNFLRENDLGDIEVLQCEVSYVNHIELGHGWSSVADFPDVFPAWRGLSARTFLPDLENVSFDTAYRMPDKMGRLRMDQRRAIRNSDGKEVIQFTITARGRPDSSSMEAILSWLDTGREWVVRGFADATSEKMHRFWGRTQ